MKSQNFLVCCSNTLTFQSQSQTRVSKPVLIRIPLETEGFWEKIYNSNDLIEKILQDFKSENYIDIPDDYFLDFYFQNKSLNLNTPISSLLNTEIPTVYINQIVKKKPLKFTSNINSPFPELVGIPFSNPFEVFLFSREDSTLEIQLYDENIINDLFLNEFCTSSAYCNGNNHLFISGGEKHNGELIDNLWEIDLKEQIIAEPIKIIPKKNHSMIFVPDKYIFIIGGNDKKCIYFNNETAEIEDWDNLNLIRTEPALCSVKNFLYCFDSVNYRNNGKFTVEKTDLDSLRPKWELLEPKMNMIMGNNITLEQQNFGVSKDDENNIIFIGGDMRDKRQKFNYKYNTNKNMIELTKIPFNNYKLKEKSFFPLKQNIDFILPAFDKDNPQVIFFMKNKNKIELIKYTQNKPEIKTKIPGADNKYDFNMPKVAIPDPVSSYNFETDNVEINGNNNIINTNSNNVNLNMNKNINNNIKKPTIFQEPQIEPAKEDLKLSLEFQNNNLLINILKDSQINKNGEYELNGSSIKENNQKDEIIINTDINKNNIKNVDLSKNINIPGMIQGNNSNKFNGNINPNINLEETEVKNSVIKFKKDESETKNKINNISTDINVESSNINNNNLNISENSINPKININTQKNISTNIKKNIPPINTEINSKKISSMIDYNLNGHIAGTKKTIYINNNNKNNSDKNKEIFKMSGIIKGTGKKQNAKQKPKETNINNKNINNINNKAKNKDNNDDIIKGVIHGTKPNYIQNEKKLSIPKLNLEGRIPDLSESDNNINNDISNKPHMIDLRGDNNTPSYEMNKNSPTFQLSLNRPKYDNTFELNGNNNNFSLNNGNIQGSKMDFSSFDNSNFKEIQIEQKNLGQRKIDLNIQNDVNIKANMPNKSINAKFDQISLDNNRNNTLNENIIISGIIPGNQLSKHPFVNKNNSINNNSQKIIYDSKNNNIQNGYIYNNIENNIYMSSKIPELKDNNNYNTGNNPYLLKSVNNNNNNIFNKQYNKNNNNLPLVGNKNSSFISSKVEPIKNVDEENIDINNLKSSNAGVNGIKLGNRIIE